MRAQPSSPFFAAEPARTTGNAATKSLQVNEADQIVRPAGMLARRVSELNAAEAATVECGHLAVGSAYLEFT
jgi:hypothetical protein